MRDLLKELDNEKSLFTGTFKSLRRCRGRGRVELESMLLLNLKNENGIQLTDHIWITYNRKFKDLKLERGDVVSFYGTVKPYKTLKKEDYGITYTTKPVKL